MPLRWSNTLSPTVRWRRSNGGSRFSVTLLAVTSITTWPSSWTLSVTAAAVTSSIMHSAGVTIPIWRRGGITTEGVIHLDSPDEQPVLAATASWTHRWFGDRHSLLLAGSHVYGAPCEQSRIRSPPSLLWKELGLGDRQLYRNVLDGRRKSWFFHAGSKQQRLHEGSKQ